MKLYTEEQLITCYNKGLREGKNNVIDSNLLYGFIPIELPSEEEIDKFAQIASSIREEKTQGEWIAYKSVITGAKWVIEQIKQQVIP